MHIKSQSTPRPVPLQGHHAVGQRQRKGRLFSKQPHLKYIMSYGTIFKNKNKSGLIPKVFPWVDVILYQSTIKNTLFDS